MTDQFAHRENDVPDWPETLTVTSADVARVLASMPEAVFLKPFMTPPGAAVGEAARHFHLPPNAVYRRVKRLERLGILQVIRQETRRGKPVRYYRSSAQRYFILPHLCPLDEWVRSGLQEQYDLFHENLLRAVTVGPNPVMGLVSGELNSHLRVAFAGRDGEVWNPRAPGTPVTKWAFKTLRLDYDRAQSLIAELRAVAQKYYADQGSTLYLLGQFMTPVTDTGGRDEDSALRVE